MRTRVDTKRVLDHIEHHIEVQNPYAPGSVPFRPMPIQREFLLTSKAMRLERHSDYAVKPRQVGLTTLNLGYGASVCVLYPGFNMLFVCQDEDNLAAVKRKFKFIHRSLIDSHGSGLGKRDVELDNLNEWVLKNGSSISFIEAGSTRKASHKTGRGDTAHYVNFTEVAYWGHAGEVLNALAPGTEHSEPSFCFDTTPNGKTGDGEWYYKRVMACKRGEIRGTVHFWAWFEDPRYSLRVDDREAFVASLDEEETRLVDAYGLSLEQLAWRREKIAETHGGEDKFKEIYPETLESAFRSTVDNVFDPDVMRHHERSIELSGERWLPGEKVRSALTEFSHAGFKSPLYQDEDRWPGFTRIYHPPSSLNAPYSMGVDCSEGRRGGDAQALAIVDRHAQITAIARMRVDPIIFASIVQILSTVYDLLPRIEDQSTGKKVAGYITEEVAPSEIAKRGAHPILERSLPAVLEKTSAAHRPKLISYLIHTIGTEDVFIPDRVIFDEMTTFVETSSGKVEHAPGHHDDILFALAIAYHARERTLQRGRRSDYQALANSKRKPYRDRYDYTNEHRGGEAEAGGDRRSQALARGRPLAARVESGKSQKRVSRAVWGLL